MTTTIRMLILVCSIHGITYGATNNAEEYFNVKWETYEVDTIVDIPLEESVEPMTEMDTTTVYEIKSIEDEAVDTQSGSILSINKDNFDQQLFVYDGANENSCLLDNIKTTLMWWTFPNGTLRRRNFNTQRNILLLDSITTIIDLYLFCQR